jgi:Domain of unknown function (DUF4349)
MKKSKCNIVRRYLSRFIDGKLSPEEERMMQSNQQECNLNKELDKLRDTSNLLEQSFSKLESSQQASARLLRHAQGLRINKNAKSRRWLRLPSWRTATAMAASLAALLFFAQWHQPSFNRDANTYGFYGRYRADINSNFGFDDADELAGGRTVAIALESFRRYEGESRIVLGQASIGYPATEAESVWDESNFPKTVVYATTLDIPDNTGGDFVFASPSIVGGYLDRGKARAMSAPIPNATDQRKIIRHAQLALEVADVTRARKDIDALLQRHNGLLAHTAISESKKSPSAQLTLWVPADNLQAVLDALEQLGEVKKLNVGAQDITANYFDQETRIRNLKIQEKRLLSLYEKKDAKLEEIIKLEKEIGRVRTEIEKLEGQQKLWDHKVELSTIQVQLTQTPKEKPMVKPEPKGALYPLKRTLRETGKILVYSCSRIIALASKLLAFIVMALPWLAIAGVLYLIIRKVLRRR